MSAREMHTPGAGTIIHLEDASRPVSQERTCRVHTLVIAGWTGRDPIAVRRHIEELATLGVAPPVAVPTYYRVAASLLTQAGAVQVLGRHSSGEAEAVLVGTDDGTFVALGSDHTDRRVEAYSVTVSKQMCPKPISRRAWRLSEVVDHWDALELSSYIQDQGRRVTYQAGRLAALRPPLEIIAGLERGAGSLAAGQVVFCGTLPAIGGVRSAARFEAVLHDPGSGETLELAYDINTIADIAESAHEPIQGAQGVP